MAYKSRTKVRPSEAAEFRIGKVSAVRQRNGVPAIKVAATMDEGMSRRDVTIFANGRRVAMVRPALGPDATVRLIGKFSQRNTFVALALAS